MDIRVIIFSALCVSMFQNCKRSSDPSQSPHIESSIKHAGIIIDKPEALNAQLAPHSINFISDEVSITISKIGDEDYSQLRMQFQHIYNSDSESIQGKHIPETEVQFDQMSGYKYGVVDQRTKEVWQTKYLLRLSNGYIFAEITGGEKAADVSIYEQVLSSVQLY